MDTINTLKMYKVEDVAEMLDVPIRWLRQQIYDGKFPSVFLGPQTIRVRHADLEAYINQHARGAA